MEKYFLYFAWEELSAFSLERLCLSEHLQFGNDKYLVISTLNVFYSCSLKLCI